NSAFQNEDLDDYDSDCDDISSAKATLMANISSCDSDVLSEVPYSVTYPNDMINQDVQEISYSEQTHIDNIIPYSKYLQESQDAVIHDTNSSAPNDLLVLSLVEQMTDHVANLDKENQINKMAQRIQPTLYDGSAIAKKHDVISIIDDEETLILEEESRSKIIEAPSELPKVSLINESLKKLKYHRTSFDKVVKKRTTYDAITAGAWGFEHTKAYFLTEIIPFIKVLKDTFNAFDKTLIDEINEVQNVFNQMEAAVDQCSVDKNDLEIQIKQLRIDNDQLLNQFKSQEIMHTAVNSVDILDMSKSCVDECNKFLELETELLKKKDFIEKEVYDKLVKSYLTLEKHCISLELATQLNQEIFQKDNFGENQNAPTFNQLFEINELKAQSQEKDMVIRKLKDMIKPMSGKDSVEKVKKDIDEIETINIELEHSVAKLLSKNENLRQEREHLKSIYKDQFDSIKKTREKVFAVAALKNELRKIKGKNIVDTAVSTPIATTIAPGMYKLDIEPISHRLKNNRDAHEVYLEKTIENNDTLRGLVECARKQNPSESLLESACMFTKHVQELLVYVSKTCPNVTRPSEKLVVVTPMNKDKKVRFAKPVTSSSNIPKQTDFLKTIDSNKPLFPSTPYGKVKLLQE
ncbi:hypothetical protein Tco_0727904, partial [Tanacetum coccineum]